MMPLSGRDAYKDELTKLAQDDDTIICLEADLGGKKHPFQKEHPYRFFNLGIAESAAIDMAAGLAKAKLKPFFSTFAPFASLRSAESIKLCLGYMRANINIVTSYGGVSGAWFGPTHHGLEDISVIQSIPGVRIALPYGEEEMRKVIREAASSPEPYYIRTGRNAQYESISTTEQSSTHGVLWKNKPAQGHSTNICLVSVGEAATDLALQLESQFPEVPHAHLCYVDQINLEKAAAEFLHNLPFLNTLLVVEENRPFGGVGSSLSLLLPEFKVYSHNCGFNWPWYGGTHEEVLNQLGFGKTQLESQIKTLLSS